jgi:hypothetical protein
MILGPSAQPYAYLPLRVLALSQDSHIRDKLEIHTLGGICRLETATFKLTMQCDDQVSSTALVGDLHTKLELERPRLEAPGDFHRPSVYRHEHPKGNAMYSSAGIHPLHGTVRPSAGWCRSPCVTVTPFRNLGELYEHRYRHRMISLHRHSR